MAGFLVRQLGFSDGDYLGPPAVQTNPYCTFEQTESITVRWTWDDVRKCTVAPQGCSDLFRSVRNRCETPSDFIVPTALQVTYFYNEFPETTWMLQISEFWSGQPIGEAYKSLPKPTKTSNDPHFTGTLNILIPPGYHGEPPDIDRVHYRALLPSPIVENYAGPVLQEEPPDVREIRGKIRYTRFENTKITCMPIVAPPLANLAASGQWSPTVMCTFVLKYCLVNGMV